MLSSTSLPGSSGDNSIDDGVFRYLDTSSTDISWQLSQASLMRVRTLFWRLPSMKIFRVSLSCFLRTS